MVNKQVYIFGAGGHARVIASLTGADRITFVVPRPSNSGEVDEAQFFERIDDYRAAAIYVGIGDNAVRKKVFERLGGLGVRPAACIASNAFIAETASIGAGTVICPGSIVMDAAQIGQNVIINTLSSVDHDCTIGDHTQIAPGVTLAGTVKVGPMCFFGVKCAVVPNVTIGANVVARAGSLIIRDVPDNVMVGGNPATIIKSV